MARNTPDNDFAFTSINYRLLLIGLAIVVVGFLLMSGGGSGDPNVFDATEVFSERRITWAPITVLVGYLFIVYAILKKTGGNEAEK